MAYGFNDDKSKEDVYSEQESQQQYYTKAEISMLLAQYYSKAQVDSIANQLNTKINAKQNTITGAASSVTSQNLTPSRVAVSNGSGKLSASDITLALLGYLSGLTGNIQTQLNGKEAKVNLTANRALQTNQDGRLAASAVTATELSYLSGVQKNIQGQLDDLIKVVSGTLTAVSSTIGACSIAYPSGYNKSNTVILGTTPSGIAVGSLVPNTPIMAYLENDAIYLNTTSSVAGSYQVAVDVAIFKKR